MLPQAWPPQPVPVTDQVTGPEALDGRIFGRNVCVVAASNWGLAGKTVIERADPLRLTDCVAPAVPPALSVTTTVALLVPAAVGVNVTLIAHDPPGVMD